MLRRPDGSTFCHGRAAYLDVIPGRATRRDAKVYVRVAIGTPQFKTTAMLDTGSSYSVLDADMANSWPRSPSPAPLRWISRLVTVC